MICDQNPGSSKGNIWVPFLGRETAFVNGPENLALKFNLPVVYIHSSPMPDDGYALSCHTLYDGSAHVNQGEIMKRFANHLEQNIKEQRSHWLWSHKRWKRVKPVSG
jgi:KDO2-lipid IV(A) lauroyltransferase